MSSLSDRLRGIVHGPRAGTVPVVAPDAARGDDASEVAIAREAAGSAPAASLGLHARIEAAASALGGSVTHDAGGPVILVDREYGADDLHGRTRIGDLIDTIVEGQASLAALGRAWPSPSSRRVGESAGDRLLFFDLETTGLAGGAGTQAFLVGCASIEGASIHTRQFLLPGFEHERALLAATAAWAQQHGALVTFNGRSFDAPLIETRYLFHRMPFPLEDVPHLDMLHPARRLWQARAAIAGPDPDGGSCSLGVLEKHLAGLHRIGDVPGFEIPSRYFQFVRDGEPGPLEAVLEHNRLDLLSLAAVMARAMTLIARGPDATTDPHECLGLARLYERAGAMDEAEAGLLRAIEMAARAGCLPDVHGEALRRLAWLRRRASRPHEAAEAWSTLASLPRCPAALRREAREALAIYHEHRSRDLATARALVLDVLVEDRTGRRRADAEHRLQRLDRKMAERTRGGLIEALDEGSVPRR